MVTIDPSVCPKDLLHARCPTRQVLDLISDKWTILVIHLLSQGTCRYGELQRQVGGISQKMLTQTLRQLEEDGLVQRQVFAEVPPRTEYSLTPLGASLRKPLQVLSEWAIEHLPQVDAAREAYAERAALAARV